MKRDKIITVRVNSELLEKVNKLIESRTTVLNYNLRNHYRYYSPNEKYKHYSIDKVTTADILEIALKMFLNNEIL